MMLPFRTADIVSGFVGLMNCVIFITLLKTRLNMLRQRKREAAAAMDANVQWKVRVLRTIEDEIEVSAVTHEEALNAARQLPGVITALEGFSVYRPKEIFEGKENDGNW